MRVVHFSETEFTTLPESLPTRVTLTGSSMVLGFHGRVDSTQKIEFWEHNSGKQWEEMASHAKREYDRFMEWLRGGDENSEFRFVLKVPQAGEVKDTPAFLRGVVPGVKGLHGHDQHMALRFVSEDLPVAAEVAAGAVILGELPEHCIPELTGTAN